MKFELNEDDIANAINQRFSGSVAPVPAAMGRVAEPIIIKHVADQLNCEIRRYDDKALPSKHKNFLGKDKCHDGLIFDENVFIGVNETKTTTRQSVWLPKHEYGIYEYCSQQGLLYLLTLGSCDINTRQCEYLGVVDFDEFAKSRYDLFTDDKLKLIGDSYKYSLNLSDFKEYFVS